MGKNTYTEFISKNFPQGTQVSHLYVKENDSKITKHIIRFPETELQLKTDFWESDNVSQLLENLGRQAAAIAAQIVNRGLWGRVNLQLWSRKYGLGSTIACFDPPKETVDHEFWTARVNKRMTKEFSLILPKVKVEVCSVKTEKTCIIDVKNFTNIFLKSLENLTEIKMCTKNSDIFYIESRFAFEELNIDNTVKIVM